MPSATYPWAVTWGSARRARLEAGTTVMQPFGGAGAPLGPRWRTNGHCNSGCSAVCPRGPTSRSWEPCRGCYDHGFEEIGDAQHHRRADHHEDSRKDKHHQRKGEENREPRRSLFEPRQANGPHLGGENPQRFSKRGAESDRLTERGRDATQAFEPCAPHQVFERCAAVRQHPHFRGCRVELAGDHGVRGAQVLADLLHRLVEAEPRLGADDEKIERIGDALLDAPATPRRETGENEVGQLPTEQQGGNHEGPSDQRHPREPLAPLEEEPRQRGECHGSAELARDKRGEVAMSPDPSCGEGGQHFFLLAPADGGARREAPSDPVVPARALRPDPRRALDHRAEAHAETILTILALSDLPERERGEEGRGQRQNEDQDIDWAEIDLADPHGQKGAEVEGLEHGYRRLLSIMTAMTATPAATLRTARPSMNRPRGSWIRTDIRSGVIRKSTPATKNGTIAKTTAEAFDSAVSARALRRISLRRRMTLLRFPRVSARLPPVRRCRARATT